MSLYQRYKIASTGEDGTSALEIVVQMSIMIVIVGLLYVFLKQTMSFLNFAQTKVGITAPQKKTQSIDPAPVTIDEHGKRIP